MARADGRDIRVLAEELRTIAAAAERGGLDRARVDAAVAHLVRALLELDAYQRGDRDPRRRETLELASRVARARAQGATVCELAQRIGRSRATVHRLLAMHVSRHRETDLRLNPREPAEEELPLR